MTYPHQTAEAVIASFNETAVRGGLVDRLLEDLGYEWGGKHSIEGEIQLRYPKILLGRRKKSDPDLTGFADYVCTAGGLVRFVIEAKAAGVPLDEASEWQAYSYANHPDVRAVYHCITNGLEWRLFRTNLGPHQPAVLEWHHRDYLKNATALKNLIGPDALLRDFPAISVDYNEGLAPGLRSMARVVGGTMTVKGCSLDISALVGLNMSISSGQVRREEGQIVARLKTRAAHQGLQESNERLGFDEMTFRSDQPNISIDPNQPTAFMHSFGMDMKAGTSLYDLTKFAATTFPMDMRLEVVQVALGHVDNGVFRGIFTGALRFVEANLVIRQHGTLEVVMV